jgi:hypothetical protein
MLRERIRRASLILALATVGLFLIAGPSSAQDMDTIIHVDTMLIIDVVDTLGSPGHAVPVSVFMQNLGEPIGGFQISITLSRPDLMQFTSDTTIDTCYTCIDSACTMLDTSLCTLEVVPSETMGTMVENWDLATATTLGGLNIRLVGIADVDADQFPLPIQPFTNGVLIKVVGVVNCDVEDSVVDRTINLDVNSVGTFFSTADAVTIPSSDTTYYDLDTISYDPLVVEFDSMVVWKPVTKLQNGSVTVPYSMKGDIDGDADRDVIDVVQLINTAFRGMPDPCPRSVGDVNCDGTIDVFDVVLLVNHVFRNYPPPVC